MPLRCHRSGPQGLLSASLLFMVVALAGSACTDAYTYCWPAQQLVLADQQTIVYDFSSLGLPCSTGGYSGNYSLQGYQGNFDIQYGDQLCGTNPDDDSYFEHFSQHYDSGFPYQLPWSLGSNYASFFPKVKVWCRWILGCKIEFSLCMTANLGS